MHVGRVCACSLLDISLWIARISRVVQCDAIYTRRIYQPGIRLFCQLLISRTRVTVVIQSNLHNTVHHHLYTPEQTSQCQTMYTRVCTTVRCRPYGVDHSHAKMPFLASLLGPHLFSSVLFFSSSTSLSRISPKWPSSPCQYHHSMP